MWGKKYLMLHFVHSFKDTIWGSIPVTEIEKEIILTPVFNRLRWIKQMSLAYTSFQGANHTRFEHSIGVMHVAYRLATSMEDVLAEKLSNWDHTMQFLRIAALLHDIGHPPFSHAVEYVFKKNLHLAPIVNTGKPYSHETYTQKIIEEDDYIGRILRDSGMFDPENIAHILGKKKKDLEQVTPSEYRMLASILDGDIDADKIDYIVRDNYYCGFPCEIDLETICRALTIEKSDEEGYKITLKPEYIHTVETLLNARLRLVSLIHYAKENRVANQMLMRSVAGYLESMEGDKRNETVRKMHEKWNDTDLYHEISKSFEKSKKAEYWETTFKRLFQGVFMKEWVAIHLRAMPPEIALLTFILQDHPHIIIDIQRGLEEAIGQNLIVDLCIPTPPPLRLRLTREESTERSYNRFLFDVSSIIRGVLIESYNKASIYIYTDEDINENDEELKHLLFEKIVDGTIHLRNRLKKEKKIEGRELILCALVGLRRFGKLHFPKSELWAYSTYHLQRFIEELCEKAIKDGLISEAPYESDGFNVDFYQDLEKLAFCGMIIKKEEIVVMDKDISSIFGRFGGFRIDHRIDETWGMEYVRKFLEPEWDDIIKEVESTFESIDLNIITDYINLQLTIDKKMEKDRVDYKKKITEYRELFKERNVMRIAI